MSANIEYNLSTSETVAWQSRSDLTDFLDSLTVPSATTGAEGVVKKASSVSFTKATAWAVNDSVTLTIGATDEEMPNMTTIEEMRTNLLAVNAALDTLLVALRNAGIINS